jgi:uridine phosphorylase
MKDDDRGASPLLSHKAHQRPSIFTPENLLREARRQKSIPHGQVPRLCVLDPDGDLSRALKRAGARCNPFWACYHTELFNLESDGATVGVLGCAVGAPFAVLVAEQLFASGCELLVSVTSAGQIVPAGTPPYFVLIDRAMRDEGTSHHYLPPAYYAYIPGAALEIARTAIADFGKIVEGGSWTTDAPFRETEEAIARARSENLLAVEMEAAGLYALAEAKHFNIVCFARVTNQMAVLENDFEKGDEMGNASFRQLISVFAAVRHTHGKRATKPSAE